MHIGAALEPLLARYAAWLGMNKSEVLLDRDEDPEQVRAIQIVLRLERGTPPSWHAALALAASGCAAVCIDPRTEPGGEWHDAVAAYSRGHIRKVTRRGRGAQWEATADLPGLSLAHDGDTPEAPLTEVRVLVPGLITEVDKRVSKLQVGSTDIPVDEHSITVAAPPPLLTPADDDSPDAHATDELEPEQRFEARARAAQSPLLTVHVPTEGPAASMTAGKLMAQTGHAGMLAAALLAASDQDELDAWREAGCPSRVARTPQAEWLDLLAVAGDPVRAWREHQLLAVRDAGFTEVPPGTVTVAAQFVR